GLMDRVPDHSTISYNRTVRFKDSNIFREIFEEIVRQAMAHRMIAGRVLFTDSTHVKANVNDHRFEMQMVTETPLAYLDELEQAVNEDREKHGKEPLEMKE